MRRLSAILSLLVAFTIGTHIAHTQGSDAAAAKPGRNPNQPIDAAYTAKIKQYTTEPFFLSPLVDYMPAKAGVPTPTAQLGDIAGAPTALIELIELACRLAVDDAPYVKNIRDHVITLITPVVEVDGRDRIVDIFKWKLAHPGLNPAAVAASDFAIQEGLTNGVSMNTAKRGTVTGTFLRMHLVDDAGPIVYGVEDGIAAYTDGGESFSVSATRGGGGGGRRAGGGSDVRATGRGRADDQDVVQGRPALAPEFEAPPVVPVSRWQYALPTDAALRTPSNIIPPAQRPRVAMRYGNQNELLVSGLLNGGGDIAQLAAVVDSPVEKGHGVMFAINPIYRAETLGTYPMVCSTLMNFDNLNAGRKLDPRKQAEAVQG